MKKFLYRVIVLLIFLPLYGAAQVGFNKGGYVTNVPNNSFIYRSVALQPDGKIVAVGITDDLNGLIARFNPDGSLDKVFDTINLAEYNQVAIDDDGKIVAVGAVVTGDELTTDSLIARFLPNGVLDAESKSNLKSFRESAQINNTPIGIMSR